MKSIKDCLNRSINENKNIINVPLGEAKITIDTFNAEADGDVYDLLDCSDEEFDIVANASDCQYVIIFDVENYGTFNGTIDINYNSVDVDLRHSSFEQGDYNIWKKFLESVCYKYIGGLEEFGWAEDLLSELEKQF